MEDAAATVCLHGVTGESKPVPTDDTSIILEVPVPELFVVPVAKGIKVPQELR